MKTHIAAFFFCFNLIHSATHDLNLDVGRAAIALMGVRAIDVERFPLPAHLPTLPSDGDSLTAHSEPDQSSLELKSVKSELLRGGQLPGLDLSPGSVERIAFHKSDLAKA